MHIHLYFNPPQAQEPEKMTEEQKKRVVELVNYAINHNYPVTFAEMTVPKPKNLARWRKT